MFNQSLLTEKAEKQFLHNLYLQPDNEISDIIYKK